jgi:hypothetical protein
VYELPALRPERPLARGIPFLLPHKLTKCIHKSYDEA